MKFKLLFWRKELTPQEKFSNFFSQSSQKTIEKVLLKAARKASQEQRKIIESVR